MGKHGIGKFSEFVEISKGKHIGRSGLVFYFIAFNNSETLKELTSSFELQSGCIYFFIIKIL